MRRCSILGGGLMLCLLAGCGQAASTAAPGQAAAAAVVPVATTGASVSYLPFYVAEHEGFFAQHGLRLQVTTVQGGGPDVQALIAGEVDFDLTATSFALLAAEKGQKLLVVEDLLDRSEMDLVLGNDVVSRLGITASTPLNVRLKDLKGLTIGVTSPGSLGDQVMRFLITQAGYQPGKTVKIAAVSSGAAMVAALQKHEVDGYMNGVLDADRAVSAKVGTIVVNNVRGQVPAMREYEQEGVLVRQDYAQQHPAVVRAFVAALVQAQAWMARHTPRQILAAAKDQLQGVEPALLLQVIGESRQAYPVDGRSTQAGIESVERLMQLAGQLKRPIPWNQVASNAYLPAS